MNKPTGYHSKARRGEVTCAECDNGTRMFHSQRMLYYCAAGGGFDWPMVAQGGSCSFAVRKAPCS